MDKAHLVCLLLLTNNSWAEGGNFDGYSAILANTFANGTFSTYIGNISENDSSQDIGIQYTLQFKNNMTFGAIIETGLSNQRVGTFYKSGWTLRDRSAIGIVPGIIFDQKNLFFWKITAISAKLNTGAQNTATYYESESVKNGVGYGVGIRHQFTKNTFAQVSYEEDQYNKFIIDTVINMAPGITQFTRSTISPITSSGMSIGIGYQF
jgi:opacity protein-like surface antigen